MGPTFYWSRLSVLVSEAVLLGLLLTLLAAAPSITRLFASAWLSRLRAFASRRFWAPASVALALIVLRLAILPWYPIPNPKIRDELSLMLGAQTFALGRLTNPPHPFWPFFETFYVLQQPTYNSIYPPAQALLLAIGIVLGHPWVAVLAASALMCGAFVWMLQAWFSPVWSLCGGVLLLFQVGLTSYWTNSYWGGSLAALSAAVVVGAVGRIWSTDRARARYSLLSGAAIAVLLNRRPFEGSIVVAGIAVATILWLIRKAKRPLSRELFRLVFPAAAVLMLGGVAVGYYDFRVTGNPCLLPYVKGIETYSVASHDILLSATPTPSFDNPEFRQFYGGVELNLFQYRKHHPFQSLVRPGFQLWAFFLGPALSVPLVFIPSIWRDEKFKPMLLIAAICLLINATETWILPHYLGPELPFLWIVEIACLQQLYANRRPIFRRLATAAIIAAVGGNLAPVAFEIATHRSLDFSWERPRIVARLHSVPGNHLVLVQYLPGHSVHEEFVYNEPNIDASRVVWARDLGWERDQALLKYYHGRRIWLLRVGATVNSLEEIRASQRP